MNIKSLENIIKKKKFSHCKVLPFEMYLFSQCIILHNK